VEELGNKLLGCFECKVIGRGQASQWGGDEAPIRVQIQLQHQMAVTGLSYGWIFGLNGTETYSYRYDCNDNFIAKLYVAVDEFWDRVKTKRPPAASGQTCDHAVLRALHPNDNGQTVKLPYSFEVVYNDLVEAKRIQSAAKESRDKFEIKMKEALGDNTFGLLPDGRSVSWKTSTSHYKAKEAYEQTKRTFRMHKQKG